MKIFRDHLIEKYNTYNRRPTAFDMKTRERMFRAYARILSRWLPEDKSAAMLDVACGEGTLLSYLQYKGYKNIYGFDLSPENVSICHKLGLTFVKQFDAQKVANFLPELRFDLVFLIDIIEHIPKDEILEFIDNIVARMNQGGVLIIQTPNMGSLFASHIRHNDLSHEFGLTEKTAIDLMMMVGLSVDEIYVGPSWNATTQLGRLRELYLRILHFVIFLAMDAARPKIPTKNLIIKATIR